MLGISTSTSRGNRLDNYSDSMRYLCSCLGRSRLGQGALSTIQPPYLMVWQPSPRWSYASARRNSVDRGPGRTRAAHLIVRPFLAMALAANHGR